MSDLKRFRNRQLAGVLLAQRLRSFFQHPNAIVLALPRKGVPVGLSIAKVLEVPLDVSLVKKLGVPGYEEYALGAIAHGGLCILQHEILEALEVPTSVVESMAQRALKEIEYQHLLYCANRPTLSLRGQIVILADDGMSTGSSMMIAVKSLRKEHPARIIVATPVAPPDTCRKVREEADDVICLNSPSPFYAVDLWYEECEQTTDEQVMRMLEESERDYMQQFK